MSLLVVVLNCSSQRLILDEVRYSRVYLATADLKAKGLFLPPVLGCSAF